MRVAPAVSLSSEQREVLEQRSRGRSLPARVVERARIVLLAAAGKQNKEIAEQLGISAQKAGRWRARFLEQGVSGLEKDAPRPGRTPSIAAKTVARVVRMTTQEKPANATHWSTRTMGAAVGISDASVMLWSRSLAEPQHVVLVEADRNHTPSDQYKHPWTAPVPIEEREDRRSARFDHWFLELEPAPR